jgi:hypothetical protein
MNTTTTEITTTPDEMLPAYSPGTLARIREAEDIIERAEMDDESCHDCGARQGRTVAGERITRHRPLCRVVRSRRWLARFADRV